jgi:predicted transcriptional regulator
VNPSVAFARVICSHHKAIPITGLHLQTTGLAFTTCLQYDVLQMQRKEPEMKTASMPSLRVDPELRHDAESVLREGETLSSFMEQALRTTIQSRRMQQEFIARGLTSRDEARRTGEYFVAGEVLAEMEAMLSRAEAKVRK